LQAPLRGAGVGGEGTPGARPGGAEGGLMAACRFDDRAVGNDPTEGNGRGTYVALEKRLTLRECGIAYGARALWRRSLHSSPRTGKPSTTTTTRRREAGIRGVLGEGGARDA